MKATIAAVVTRVVAQDVLLCEISGDLLKSLFKFAGRLGDVNGAPSLPGKLFHPPLGGEGAHVRVVVESRLHDEDLTVVSEHSLDRRFKIIAAGSVRAV